MLMSFPTMPRARSHHGAGIVLIVGVAMAAAAVSAGSAQAAVTLSATSGPVGGGTAVTVASPGDTAFTFVASGARHTVALGDDGGTYSWGQDVYGQLGNGETVGSTSAPTTIATPAGVTFIAIDAGDDHSVAIGDDGHTYAWGLNTYGQLGDGTTTSRSTPTKVQAPTGVTFTSVAAGEGHTLAIGDDGSVYAWGWNLFGQLGDGTTTNGSIPTKVPTPTDVDVTSIAAGGYHSLATGDDGTTYAWGNNANGQLGDESKVQRLTPTPVKAPDGVSFGSIAAGAYHSLAISLDGTPYGWGFNDDGAVGDGTSGIDRLIPTEALAPTGVSFTLITVDTYTSLAVGDDGNVYVWGYNGGNQLGDGTYVSTSTPTKVATLPDGVVVSVAASPNHATAITTGGATYAWGFNAQGVVGDGTTTTTSEPVEIFLPASAVTAVLFDGVAGTDLLLDSTTGAWTVTTPAGESGRVDVVIEWTLGGIAQTPLTLTSAFTYVTTPAAPAAPTSVRGDGEVTISWLVPSDDGGTSITSYAVEHSLDDGATWVAAPGTDPAITTVIITGLEAGQTVLVRVAAVNSEGQGPWSEVLTTASLDAAAPTPTPTPTPAPTVERPAALAATGGDLAGELAPIGVMLLLVGLVTVAVSARTRRDLGLPIASRPTA